MTTRQDEPDGEGHAAGDELIREVTDAVILYGGMFGGFVAGQLLGIIASAAFGARLVWLPIAFGLVLEGVVGARIVARRRGRPAQNHHALSARESFALSARYTLVFVAVTAPLAVWTGAAQHAPGLAAWAKPGRLALVALALAVATLLRAAIIAGAARPRRA